MRVYFLTLDGIKSKNFATVRPDEIRNGSKLSRVIMRPVDHRMFVGDDERDFSIPMATRREYEFLGYEENEHHETVAIYKECRTYM